MDWGLWLEWSGHAEWTVRQAAERLVETIRLTVAAYPGSLASFTIGDKSKVRWSIDSPGLADRLVQGLTGTTDDSPFVHSAVRVWPVGGPRVSVKLQQFGGDQDEFPGRLRLDFSTPLAAAGAELTARLGVLWTARNAWVDFVHVRQEWNHWRSGLPVYGWATWLHPSFATVETTGLDVDVTTTEDGGSLITLRVDPAAMADDEQAVGKETILALARRTVLADGRRVIDLNQRLRDEASQP
jgi:hypothetical protein